jgi:fructokinase
VATVLPGGRFVVVGESLVDVVAGPQGEERAVGGSPLNVAVGLSRLDVPSALVTELGEDDLGRLVEAHLRADDVALHAHRTARTSTATARARADHTVDYAFDLAWELPGPLTLPADALGLHVGSLGVVLEPGRDTVLDLVSQAESEQGFVSFDPNVRPSFVDDGADAWRRVRELSASARLVKLSDEDLRTLRPDAEPASAAVELLAGATELVVMTRGAQGAAAFGSGLAVEVPGPAVDVVDTVGAGDAFMAALLATLVGWDVVAAGPGALSALDERRIGLLLEGATTVAAVTCARRGANPPRRSELPPTWPAG